MLFLFYVEKQTHWYTISGDKQPDSGTEKKML